MLSRKTRARWRIFWRCVVNFFRVNVLKREHVLPVVNVIHLTHTCNANCRGCSQASALAEQKHPEITLEDWQAIMEKMLRLSPTLYVSGGEPTLSPILVPLLKWARERGFWPITVNTNGLALDKHPEVLRYADRIVVSLHSGSISRASHIMGVNILRLRHLILSLKHLAREARTHGNQVMLNCPLSGHNIDSVTHLISFAFRMQTPISFTPLIVNHEPEILRHEESLRLKYREFVDLLQRVKRRVPWIIANSRAQLQQMHDLAPFDCRPSCLLTVNPDGTVQNPCPHKYNERPAVIGSLIAANPREVLSLHLNYTGQFRSCPSHCCKTCFVAPALSLQHPWDSFWTYVR